MERVVLGLSGGVDSAVAARRLQAEGFEVFGLYLDIGLPGGVMDAEKAADSLGISLRVLDISQALDERVCRVFVEEYMSGRTPNPCIICNPNVKFQALCSYADEIRAEHIATGHYARVSRGAGETRLLKAQGLNDQSYMLCRIKPRQLARLLLPLGDFPKSETREFARAEGLALWSKPDSMEICFIPDGDFAGFIEARAQPPGSGNFIDRAGNILGSHLGYHRYTLGQRRGLGISAGERVFVTEIRPDTNEVVLGGDQDLFRRSIQAGYVNWLIPVPRAEICATVKVRHSKQETPARVIPQGDSVLVEFEEAVRAPAPGQSAVFYQGDRLLGGGFILDGGS